MTGLRRVDILENGLIAGCQAGMVSVPLYMAKRILNGNGGIVGLIGTGIVSFLRADLMEEGRIERRIDTVAKASRLWLYNFGWVILSTYTGNKVIDYLFPSSKDTLWVGHIDFWVSATALAFTLYVRMQGEPGFRRTQPNF